MDAGAEDAVFYSIYPDFVTDGNGDEEDLLSRLEGVKRECLEAVAPLVQGYIWQHGHFDLHAALSPPPSHVELKTTDEDDNTNISCPSPIVPLVYGHTRYGHNVEDAWFVVYLLFEISRCIADVSIRVWDTDGEFLLIEAAYEIPRWLESETSRNRIFIRRGQVHILPLPTSPAQIELANPSLMDALKVLASGKVQTRASDAVQRSISRRISGYPRAARKSMHKVKCRLPLRVAQVLKCEPQMVALAVEAFYRRYQDDLLAAARMEKFLTKNSEGEHEMVTVVVTMSRAMYAQLKLQVFHAPRVYPMPSGQTQKVEDEIGMKLACGFEMMYADFSRFRDEEQLSGGSSLASDVGWQAFRKRLEDSGYFRNLLPGSKEYRELMEAALSRYKHTEVFSRVREAMRAPVKRIDEILATDYKVEDFSEHGLPENDDDSWLYSGEQELESVMQEEQHQRDEYEKQRRKKKQGKGEAAATGEEVASKMKAFVDKTSSFEGAEVPGDEVDVDMRKLLGELRAVLGDGPIGEGEEEAMEVESDFDYDDDEDFGEEEEEVEVEDAETEGSSKAKQVFMEEYSDVMEHELRKSSIPKTFAAKDDATKSSDIPVDVDFNLVKNLLESYSSQQGLPGPASNILGLMGMQLPDDEKQKTVSKK